MIIVRARLPIFCWFSAFLGFLAGCGGNPGTPTGPLTVTELAGTPQAGEPAGGTGPTVVLGTAVPGGPVAQINASATVGIAPLTIRLDGTGSRAASGNIAQYVWEFGDGQVGAAAVIFHTFATPGVYAVRLTVYDEQGQSSEAGLEVVALPPVQIVCTPGALGPAPLRVGFAVDMMGDISGLPVGVDYRWDFGDGTQGLGPSVVHLYERPGRYTVTLILLVGSLFLQGDQLVVTVQESSTSHGNQPPVADAGPDQVVVDDDGDGVVKVRLDGSRSHDPDGRIVWYCWRGLLGSQQAEILAEGSLALADVNLPVGEHEITLTVTDDCGATDDDALRVTVRQRAALTVTPADDFISHGEVGDAFSPAQIVYVLRNDGQQALEWTVAYGQAWLAASPNAGSLAGGQSVSVTVSLAGTPALLGVGVHRDTLIFTNRTNGVGTTTRVVEVTVTDPAMLVISGRVTEGGVGLPDVIMEGLPGNPTTDAQGYYQANVPHGWSGLVLPTKVDYTFDPLSRRYTDVTADQLDQDYTATAIEPQYADHVSQYGITWTFDKPYRVGQFVNGDWWVLGPVVVQSVDPAWDGIKNGSMIDPLPEGDQVPYQGLDSRAAGYAPHLRQIFPVAIDPATYPKSLVSVIGRPTQAPGGAHQALSDAAVLTVLAQVPPADAFRPPWCGGGAKPLWRKGHINWGQLPAVPLPSGVTLPDDYSKVCRPWIDFGPYGQTGSEIHPENNMPPYPRDMVAAYGRCSLACLVDTNPNRYQWATALVQIGIDLYEVSKNNEHGWRAYGGFGMGRKWPIMFAGILLECPTMRAPSPLIVSDKGVNTWKYGEDGHSFIGDATPTYPHGAPMFGWNCAENGYAYPDFFANHDCRDPDEEFECEPFGPGEVSDIKRMLPEYGWPGANPGGYRKLNVMVWTFEALPCLMMGGRDYWNHDAFFALVDRCVAEQWGGPEYMGFYGKDSFVRAMWIAYRGEY